MLPKLYLDYLKSYLSASELLTLQILIWLLQVYRQVKIEKLASSFPYPIKCESRRRKIQRFLVISRLSLPLLWFPLIEKIIKNQFKRGDRLILTLDRTQWTNNNILMVSAIWKKRALPIYWMLLNKQGSSNFNEQIAVIRPVLRLLKQYNIVVIGDREFRSTALATWLNNKRVNFILRLNKNTLIKQKYKQYQSLDSLGIKPGNKVLYRRVLVTEQNQRDRFNLVIYWKRKYNKNQLPQPWYLITNLDNRDEVIKIFSSRGGIEGTTMNKKNKEGFTDRSQVSRINKLLSNLPYFFDFSLPMFRDCKRGGYTLEGTKANSQRLTNLILLIAIAYTASCLLGLNIRKSGHQEYINRLKTEGQNRHRHSYFWTGLYGSTWCLAFDLCWEWVERLMRLTPNKLVFYRRGLRAMKLIHRAV